MSGNNELSNELISALNDLKLSPDATNNIMSILNEHLGANTKAIKIKPKDYGLTTKEASDLVQEIANLTQTSIEIINKLVNKVENDELMKKTTFCAEVAKQVCDNAKVPPEFQHLCLFLAGSMLSILISEGKINL